MRYDVRVTSHEGQGISNHQQIVCLFVLADIKQNIKAPCYWPFVRGIHRWLLFFFIQCIPPQITMAVICGDFRTSLSSILVVVHGSNWFGYTECQLYKASIFYGQTDTWVNKTSFGTIINRSCSVTEINFIITSRNGTAFHFRVSGPLWGESTGDPWYPPTERSVTRTLMFSLMNTWSTC